MKALKPVFYYLAVTALALAAALWSSYALAQEAPDVLVKRVSQDMLNAIKNDMDLQAGDYRRVQELVEGKILPNMDFEKTTAMAVGRYWRDATLEQRQRLIIEFRSLLIHTYSGALSQVKDQRLEFSPLRADPADTEVEVRSRVIQSRGEPIQMNYRLAKSADGWKIYDVNILGAWLIETYKGSFVAEINRSGIDGLINTLAGKNNTLAEKNRKLGSGAARPQKNAG